MKRPPSEGQAVENDETPSFRWIVPESDGGARLDLFLLGSGRFTSRNQVRRLILERNVWVDGCPRKPGYRLRPLQEIRVELPPPTPTETRPEPIPLEIVYEDEDLLVVNKPPGMVVHPAAGHPGRTLVNALLFHCSDLSGIGGKIRPGIVHRLDKETSGLLVVAKSDRAHLALAEQFRVHSIRREYLGLVHGRIDENRGRIEAPIGRHVKERKKMSSHTRRGRKAVTHWRVERRFRNFTLLRFTLETGRTHQIRVHMAERGHPIVGDAVYGGKKTRLGHLPPTDPDRRLLEGLDRFFLHAETLGFRHPRTDAPLHLSRPLPPELAGVLASLRPPEAS